MNNETPAMNRGGRFRWSLGRRPSCIFRTNRLDPEGLPGFDQCTVGETIHFTKFYQFQAVCSSCIAQYEKVSPGQQKGKNRQRMSGPRTDEWFDNTLGRGDMSKSAFAFTICLLAVWASGCAGTHIARNSAQVGTSLERMIEQQVLDNLAKFDSNPNAMPHMAIPNLAASDVTQNINSGPSFNFNPFRLTTWSVGLTGTHTDDAGFTLETISDPEKLMLMRCVYQRAVHGTCRCSASGSCPDCELRLRKFYFGKEFPDQANTITSDGEAVYLYDPEAVKAVLEDRASAAAAEEDANTQQESTDRPNDGNDAGDDPFSSVNRTVPGMVFSDGIISGNGDESRQILQVQAIQVAEGTQHDAEMRAERAEQELLQLQEMMQKEKARFEERIQVERVKGLETGKELEARKIYETIRSTVGEQEKDLESYEESKNRVYAYLKYDFFNVPTLRDMNTDKELAAGEKTIDALKKAGAARLLYEPQSLRSLAERTGRLTPACLASGWICQGKPSTSFGQGACCKVGTHCGNHVWVPADKQNELSKLTLVILQIALNNAPEAKKEETITLNLGGKLETASTVALSNSQKSSGSTDFWDGSPGVSQGPATTYERRIEGLLRRRPLSTSEPLAPGLQDLDPRPSPTPSLIPLGRESRYLDLIN